MRYVILFNPLSYTLLSPIVALEFPVAAPRLRFQRMLPRILILGLGSANISTPL